MVAAGSNEVAATNCRCQHSGRRSRGEQLRSSCDAHFERPKRVGPSHAVSLPES